MLRLVRGVHSTSCSSDSKQEVEKDGGVERGAKVDLIDARPLTSHDSRWNVTIPTETGAEGDEMSSQPQDEATRVLDRDQQLLAKVDDKRKYQGYFVVDRT